MKPELLTAITTLAKDATPAQCLLCNAQHAELNLLCASCATQCTANQHACERCGLPNQTPLCTVCLNQPPPYVATIAPLIYSGSPEALIHRWKYQREPQLTSLLVKSAMPYWPTQFPKPDILVPVPSHWRRRWARGFDQTWLLAQAIRKQLKLSGPVVAVLRRRRATPHQNKLPAQSRAQNVRRAFTVRADCVGADIALVDDVVTTGATVSAATQTLLAAGANSVQVWCLARVDVPGNGL